MATRALALIVLALFPAACGSDDGGGGQPDEVVLATTPEVERTGLLTRLEAGFEEDTDYTLATRQVAGEEAVDLGRRGEVDVLLVNVPAAEEELMASPSAGTRSLVMHSFGEGPTALDVYHVIDITGEAGEGVNNIGGRAFAQWIVSDPGQDVIERFGEEESSGGRPRFVADAGKSLDDLQEEAGDA